MKKGILITFLLLALTISAKAKINAGVGWGYCPQVLKTERVSYIPNSIGYRISDGRAGFSYFTNEFIYASVGADITRHFSMLLKGGFMGVDYNYIVTPITAEARYYFKGYDRQGLFLSMEGGIALHDWDFEDRFGMLSAGMGHREMLFESLSLDFIFRITCANYHPLPLDKYEGVIPRPQVIYSNTHSLLISLGVGLNF